MKLIKYKTLYADPPWSERGGGKIKRGADRHYPLMKTKDIMALPVSQLVDENAHLYLWVTNNFMQDGFKVMEAWGFRYVTMITWAKDKMSLGQYYRGMTEHCLFGVRGRLPYKMDAKTGKRMQGTTLITAPRTQHSVKPKKMREMIERVSYPPYIELFSRSRNPAWDHLGNAHNGQDITHQLNELLRGKDVIIKGGELEEEKDSSIIEPNRNIDLFE